MNILNIIKLLKSIGLLKEKQRNTIMPILVLAVSGGLVTILMAIFLAVSGNDPSSKAASADNREERYAVVQVNRRELKVEIASDFKEQYQGLSNRSAICADCGMLFVFPDSGVKSFVMRRMEFPLDIIFIDNGVIRNIAANLEPEGAAPQNIYESAGPADQVLEVNGGYCERHDIKPGDKVSVKE